MKAGEIIIRECPLRPTKDDPQYDEWIWLWRQKKQGYPICEGGPLAWPLNYVHAMGVLDDTEAELQAIELKEQEMRMRQREQEMRLKSRG